MQNKSNLKKIVAAGLIAALYAGLTYISAAFGLAFGPIQLRLSEALTVLPIFTPAAIPALTIGCFFANIISYNPLDLIFGTAATLIAAILTYLLKNIRIKGFPFLSFLSPIAVNGILIGAQISFIYGTKSSSLAEFLLYALYIALSEAAVCLSLGTALFYALNSRKNLFD